MEIINYLGEKLAKRIDISPLAARGLLKLAIKDELGPFETFSKLSFNDLLKVIQNALKGRLEKIKVGNTDEIVKFMLNELSRSQSLLTFSLA